MPLFNAIGQPRWNSPLVRFFGMKIGSAAAPSLAPEIAPSFDVNQMDDPQLYFLRNERLGQGGTVLAAAAGFFSSAQLRNPANSGVLLILKGLTVYATGASVDVSVVLNQAFNLTNVLSNPLSDTRWFDIGTTGTAGIVSSRNNNAGIAGSAARLMQVPVGTLHTITDVVLAPGDALVADTSVVNAALWFGFKWRERPIPAEELATG